MSYNSIFQTFEYCTQFEAQHYEKNMQTPEKVHRRVKLVSGNNIGSWTEMKKLQGKTSDTSLLQAQQKETKGDLIEVFECIKGINKMNYNFFRLCSVSRTIVNFQTSLPDSVLQMHGLSGYSSPGLTHFWMLLFVGKWQAQTGSTVCSHHYVFLCFKF